jgi:hypothetical protein
MRGPTAVGTACVSRSWTVLDQVGTEIRHRKILPILEPTHRGWGGLGSNQQTSLRNAVLKMLATFPIMN